MTILGAASFPVSRGAPHQTPTGKVSRSRLIFLLPSFCFGLLSRRLSVLVNVLECSILKLFDLPTDMLLHAVGTEGCGF